MKNTSFASRQAEAKRKSELKSKQVANVCAVVDALWRSCTMPGNSFTEQERRAVADARHSLNGIQGGWINYRKIRL